MNYSRNLSMILGAGGLAIVCATLGVLSLIHRPLPPDGDPVLGGPQLLMLETDWCDWCERFRRKVGRNYQTSEYGAKAPLRYMSVDDGPPPKRYRLSSFKAAPMLVIFDQYGRELDRITTEPDSAAVESMVRRNLRNMRKI